MRHGGLPLLPDNQKKPKKLFIPYHKGLSETNEKQVTSLKIRTVFKTQSDHTWATTDEGQTRMMLSVWYS